MPRGKTLTDAERAKRDAERAKKFKDVGTKRLNNALTAINRLIPLANKNQYVFTDEQVKKINDALSEAVKRVGTAMAGGKASTGGVEL